MAAAVSDGRACVQVLFVRGARVLGSKTYYPPLKLQETPAQVLAAFIPQFYLGGQRVVPAEIIVNAVPEDADTSRRHCRPRPNAQVKLRSRVRDARAQWLQLAQQTAETNLVAHLAGRQTMLERLQALQDLLGLPELPERMECFDISHSSGEATVASCVVFDQHGPRKSDYRKFNIEGITPGDDYAAMHQALERRYTATANRRGAAAGCSFYRRRQRPGQPGHVGTAGIAGRLVLKSSGWPRASPAKPGFETLINGATGKERQLPP